MPAHDERHYGQLKTCPTKVPAVPAVPSLVRLSHCQAGPLVLAGTSAFQVSPLRQGKAEHPITRRTHPKLNLLTAAIFSGHASNTEPNALICLLDSTIYSKLQTVGRWPLCLTESPRALYQTNQQARARALFLGSTGYVCTVRCFKQRLAEVTVMLYPECGGLVAWSQQLPLDCELIV